MSNEERHQILGKALEEFASNKSHLSALRKQSHDLGECLHEIGYYLCGFGRNDPGAIKARKALADVTSIEEITRLVEEIEAAKSKNRDYVRFWLTQA